MPDVNYVAPITVLIGGHDSAVTGMADRVLTLDDGLLRQPESSILATERG